MARPFNPDLTKYWKICLPATLAGTVEFYLMDSVHKKPKYGERAKLLTDLLEGWVARQKLRAEGKDPIAEEARVITDAITASSTPLDRTGIHTAVMQALENLRAAD